MNINKTDTTFRIIWASLLDEYILVNALIQMESQEDYHYNCCIFYQNLPSLEVNIEKPRLYINEIFHSITPDKINIRSIIGKFGK